VADGVDGEILCSKETPGAPGRTRTRDTRFRKPMTRGFGSPAKSANPKRRLASSFFMFLPIYVNLPQFVPIIVTNWSQDLVVVFA